MTERPGLHWIGSEQSCPIDEISESMGATFTKLRETVKAAGTETRTPLSIYTKWDFKTATCTYIAALTVDAGTTCPGTISGEIPPHQAYGVIHLGPYDHLGNGWSAAYSHVRAGKFKCPKRGPFPYELYVNEPGTVPESDIRTEIYLPVR